MAFFYQIYSKVKYTNHNWSMWEANLLSYKDARGRIKKLKIEFAGSLMFTLMRTAIKIVK